MTRTDAAVEPAIIQFLTWVAVEDRSYDETMAAWRTSCPRLSVWEDASIAGYVALRTTDGRTLVVLTPEGRAALDAG